jgi:Excreted virulence factor EspC, type VII ESX diderm
MPDVFFTVDPDGLDSLRSQLDRIGTGLQEIGQVAGSYHPLELGPDPAVWDALQKFDASWSAGVATIRRNLTALEGLLGTAAADYRGTDQQIAQTAAQSGTAS